MDHAVDATWRNVAVDRSALALAEENGGKLPQILVADRVLINPTWAELAPLVGRDPREQPRPLEPRPYASAGACSPAPAPGFD